MKWRIFRISIFVAAILLSSLAAKGREIPLLMGQVQPAIGRRVCLVGDQWGEYDPDPSSENCCDFDIPSKWLDGTCGKIIGGPSFGRWRVLRDGTTWNFFWQDRRGVRWFLRDQFTVQ